MQQASDPGPVSKCLSNDAYIESLFFWLFTNAETYGQNTAFIWQLKSALVLAQTELIAMSTHSSAERTELNFPAHLEGELTDVTSAADWHLFLKMHWCF